MKRAPALLLFFIAMFCVAAPRIDTESLESKIHEAVNAERKKCSLPALTWDDRLAAIARAHSRDMAARDFLGHDNPEGDEPMDRVRKNGFVEIRDFEMVAENIFQIDTVREVRTFIGSGGRRRQIIYNSPASIVRQCVSGWLNSPGHRKNLLNPHLEAEGIGVVLNKKGEILITEVLLKRGQAGH